ERSEDDARRPEHDREHAGPHGPHADRARLLVAGTAGRSRLVYRREPFAGNPERLADLLAPPAPGDVEEQRSRRLRGVDHALAGESQPDVVLGQQDVRGALPDLRLVATHPEQLRRGEAGQRAVARQLEQPLAANRLLDLLALRARALVVPEDR